MWQPAAKHGAVDTKKTAAVANSVLPTISKIVAISTAGAPARRTQMFKPATLRPVFSSSKTGAVNPRRPGLQHRWKSSDRVAIL